MLSVCPKPFCHCTAYVRPRFTFLKSNISRAGHPILRDPVFCSRLCETDIVNADRRAKKKPITSGGDDGQRTRIPRVPGTRKQFTAKGRLSRCGRAYKVYTGRVGARQVVRRPSPTGNDAQTNISFSCTPGVLSRSEIGKTH